MIQKQPEITRHSIAGMLEATGYDPSNHCVTDCIHAFCKAQGLDMPKWGMDAVNERKMLFVEWFNERYTKIED